jgi:hypothetical protein
MNRQALGPWDEHYSFKINEVAWRAKGLSQTRALGLTGKLFLVPNHFNRIESDASGPTQKVRFLLESGIC